MSERICFDLAREARIGLPEAVYSEGKDPESLRELLRRFARGSGRPILFTRLSPEQFALVPEEVRALYDYDPLSRTAWGEKLPPKGEAFGRVAIVTAGTSDAFVSHEAGRTLEYLGIGHAYFEDCGVAGLWRLERRLPEINACSAVIVCAGLDAALASVLGGLTPLPLFAVPTSVGYGAAEGGRCALSSVLSSCAPGICAFNIDNGYGAACAAARMLGVLNR